MAEIGPVLPPGFRKSADDSDGDDDRDRTDRRTDVCAPALPPGFQRSPESHQSSAVIGPALPPGLAGHSGDDDDDDDDDDDGDDDDRAGQRSGDRQEFCGPALPPGFKKSSSPGSGPSQSVIGPALPPGFSRSEVSALQVGAALPAGYSDDDDDDDDDELIGPMLPPSGEEDAGMSVAQEFDKRARAMKDKLEGKNQVAEVTEREEWMLELPSAMTSFGMGPRTFRRNAKPDMGDRSVWTDTPADKARKAAKGKDDTQQKPMKPADLAAAERDIRLREQVSTYNEKKRGSSLLDQHQKARKRKTKEEEDEPKERRPFDRDLDLGAGQLDAAKRRQLIKNSRQLNDRFSSGGQQFL